MTIINLTQVIHPIVESYIQNKWALVPIPNGTKGPTERGWNKKENILSSANQLPQGYGIGLAHAYSGTMALDIDDWNMASVLLQNEGVDIQSLWQADDAVIIYSGRQGRGKLLYQMPFGLVLPTKKIIHQSKAIYELRCGTSNGSTMQDVLPPSIHPETGQPYQWMGKGHWARPPIIPISLIRHWQKILDIDKQRNIDSIGISASWQEIRGAMEVISPDISREEWISIGMALHWAGCQTNQIDQALVLWNDWSIQSKTKYPGQHGIIQQWNSFKADRSGAIRLGTLFHIARQHGYTRPAPDVSELFSNQEPEVNSDPFSFIRNSRPAAPELDLSLWPEPLTRRAAEVSETIGCDPLIPLFAGLSAICGVVDARSRLELLPGFRVPPVLWLLTIGDPADKKSPGSMPMLDPLQRIEQEDRPRFKKALVDWEAAEAVYGASKKSFINFITSSEGMLGAEAPPVADLPDKPAPLTITVGDITSQQLVRYSRDNQRGLLCHLDETNSWVNKLTILGSGEDRSCWVQGYEAKQYKMDRVGAGSIHSDNFAVSIYGNMQPGVLKENIHRLSYDGLLQRFIPAVLRPEFTKRGEPVPDYLTHAAHWESTLRLVYRIGERHYKLSNLGYRAFREFQTWYEQMKKDQRLLMTGDVYMTAFGKLEGVAGRLMLIFHMIEAPFNQFVSLDVVNRVVQIVKDYVIPAYRYTFSESAALESFDAWINDYIIQNYDKGRISLSDLKMAARDKLYGATQWTADAMVIGAMSHLESCHWVARVDDGTREHQHHAEWVINPCIGEQFAEYRMEVVKAKERIKALSQKLTKRRSIS